jgi:hypothetical protein
VPAADDEGWGDGTDMFGSYPLAARMKLRRNPQRWARRRPIRPPALTPAGPQFPNFSIAGRRRGDRPLADLRLACTQTYRNEIA